MKKGVSILLSLFMLTAIMHVSVATHYCGGKEVATKISITGMLADCGMGGSEKQLPLQGTSFRIHCCDNYITYCGTDSNYTLSSFFVPDSSTHIFQISAIPVKLSANPYTDLIPFSTNVSPPGILISTNVDLCDICVFRM